MRYAIIDANETRQSGGKEATQYLNRILPVGSRIAIVRTSNGKSYDRDVIGIVYHHFIDINLAMLRAGYAVIDTRYLAQISGDMQRQYISAQNRAIKHKLGRWRNSRDCAQMPWEWRSMNLNSRR